MFDKIENSSFSTSEIFLFKDSDILCEVVYNINFRFSKNRWTELCISKDKVIDSIRSIVYIDIAAFCHETKIEILEQKSLFIKALKNAVEYGSMFRVYKSLDDNLSLEIEIIDVYRKQNHDRKLKLKQIFKNVLER